MDSDEDTNMVDVEPIGYNAKGKGKAVEHDRAKYDEDNLPW